MNESILSLISVLAAAFFFGTPLLLGTTGEIMTEKSGSLNLGVEGTMAVGAIGGYLGACSSNSLFVGIICAFLSAAMCGMLYSFLTVSLKANQNVTGLAMTIFGVGLASFIGQTLNTNKKYPLISAELSAQLNADGIPLLRDIPYIGELFFSFNPLVYVAIAIAIVVWVYIFKTKSGLKMRAAGENPASADSVGINVNAIRYINNSIGSGIMGIGGLYMACIINNGAWNINWINGYGWIAVALVIFAGWSPVKAIGGSFIFGLLLALPSRASVLATALPTVFGWLGNVPVEVFRMLPFIVTIIVLIVNSVRKSKANGSPAAIGLNYYREDR